MHRVIPRENSSQCPKFYGLPKIHKEGYPLRPIVSSINSPTQELARYLARLLQPQVEKANSFVKNAEHLLSIVKDRTLNENEILVSFDVVSLFTKVPVQETINIIKNKYSLPNSIIDLINHCISNTFFTFSGQIYKQLHGAPMGSPLSPVLANIFMENLEVNALSKSQLKPSLWLRYIDDIFIIWPHGLLELEKFHEHLNNQHENIKFTIEIESNNQLPFLDLLLIKNIDGSFGHTVFRKKTHTQRYLHANSHHHPSQIKSIPITLITRSRRLTDQTHLNDELTILRSTLNFNGYNNQIINQAINHEYRQNNQTPENTPFGIITLPYVRGTTDKICKILKKYNIKTIFNTHTKISNILRNIKDRIPLETQGVYEIPCGSCEMSYIGQTNRKVSARVNEHKVAVRNKTSTSTLAQHVSETQHSINFEKTVILAQEKYEEHRTYREAIEILKRPHCMNRRNDAQRLPDTWKTALT